MIHLSEKEVDELIKKLNDYMKQFGFECAPFKVKWYNSVLKHERFKLKQFPEECVAIAVITNPDMWQELKKFYHNPPDEYKETAKKDIVHSVTKYYVKHFISKFLSDYDVDVIHDFDMRNNLPRLLCQTMGHVSGIARYYQPQEGDPKECKYGVSIHKEYGGYFGYRAGIFLKNVACQELKQKDPPDCIDEPTRVQLLKFFNAWDMRFRSISNPKKKYDEEQMTFWEQVPEKRVVPPP